MQKQTIKRFSLLGLVLIAASAVTAAIIPNDKNSDTAEILDGTLTQSNRLGQQTCQPEDEAEGDFECHMTATSGDFSTTTGANASSNATTLDEDL